MAVTAQQIALVQHSFDEVAPEAYELGAMFYYHLIASAPHLRPLLRRELGDQRMKMMHLMAALIFQLNDMNALNNQVESVARQLAPYSLGSDDYQTIGSVLLWTLQESLGSRFTPDVQNAWSAVYSALAKVALSATVPTVG